MITNNNNVHPLLAVWLARDTYNHSSDKRQVSVTQLLGSTKQIILSRRIKPSEATYDVMQVLAARIGTAVHNASEEAWLSPELPEILKELDIHAKVNVNPSEPTDDIDVYLEGRVEKELNGWIISGQYDAIFDGQLLDIKTTGTFSYSKKDKSDYINQMSIYRWLNQDKVDNDTGLILMVMKDWQAFNRTREGYPTSAIETVPLRLKSLHAIEEFIEERLIALDEAEHLSQDELQPCTAAERWCVTTFQVFKDSYAKRALKNCDTYSEALNKQMSLGYGIIKSKESKSTKCTYCNAFAICKQGQSLSH